MKQLFDCGYCKRIFEAEGSLKKGVKYIRCPHCTGVDRYDLSRPVNSVNCNDTVAELDGLY